MGHDHETLMKDIRIEADLCRNEGVEELADLLDDAASSIDYLLKLVADLRGANK